MKLARLILTMVCALLAVVSCTEQRIGEFFSGTRREYREALSRAESLMADHPDSALLVLDSLGQHEREFGRHFRMQFQLHRLNAENKTDVTFTSDSLAKVLVDHFNSHGTTNERMLAHYLLGRAYCDMGEAPRALQTYYDAIDCADTTKTDCNFSTLKGIYGQMAQIFHKQNLPHDEIWAIKQYISCISKTGNMEKTIVANNQLIRPYYLLNEKDTVLQIINKTYLGLKKLGNSKRAAGILSPAIYIYTERKQLDKAKQLIDIFESESGLFDEKGNIVHGREHYYITKGFYKLAINQVDSAELNFRKAIQYDKKSDAYKGLLEVYLHKSNLDSIVYYSKLNEAALDTLHNQMQTAAIHQMSELYNYNRSLKIAEQERAKARESRFVAWGIAILALIIIVSLSIIYSRYNQKKEKKIKELNTSLNSAKLQRREVQEELKQLKAKDYDALIAEKDKKEKELTRTIEGLQEKLGRSQEEDSLEDFSNSKIAQIFIKKAELKSERPIPTEAEWKFLVLQFSKDLPSTYQSFGGNKALSTLELRTCILLLLDFTEKTIVMMTQSTSPTVSQAKARANEKLFGEKYAPSLKNNLLSSLKHV